MRRSLSSFVLIAVAAVASACLWDYDTFATEAKGKDDLVSVLAGRFERNPPLYYEMRLKHGLEEIKKTPTALGLYDNAAVAAERLGKSDEAIRIIELKRTHLKPLPQDKEDWYRYYANIGTFHAHRGITKKGEERVRDLKLGEQEIKKAIEINPDAHFGREKYQLYAIQWLIDQVGRKEPYTLWSYMSGKELINRENGDDAAVEGLSGLIRLGSGWESLDIWGTLAVVLSSEKDSSLAQFAVARVHELEAQGKKSAVGPYLYSDGEGLVEQSSFESMVSLEASYEPTDEIAKDNKAIYADLRSQADKWHTNRTAYMMARLKEGSHPDWDKDFWKEWEDEPGLKIPGGSQMPMSKFVSQPLNLLAVFAVVGVILFTILMVRRKRG